jgi:membrane fusion protein (multidrug efflux system)
MPDGQPPQTVARLPQSAPPAGTSAAAPAAPSAGRLRARLFRLVVIGAAGSLAVLFATQWDRWAGNFTRQTTNDAYVRGDVTPLSAQVEGYVRNVAVNDFQRVKAGDLLVEIDDQIYAARVAQAEADLLGAQAAIENIKAHKGAQKALVAQAEATIVGTRADLERAKLEDERQRKLLATTFGTEQRVEQADAAEKRLNATLTSNQAALDAQRAQLAVLDTQESQIRADAKAKQAAADLAKVHLSYTRIMAPVDGEVSERTVYNGQYVHGGSQVITIVPLNNVWVIANYKETQLTHVAIGQRAEIRVDTFPGYVIPATVESVSPASGAQFSLLPPDNATGNFTKVVQRIPVKLKIGADNPLAGHLLPGMSVETTILTNTTPPPP